MVSILFLIPPPPLAAPKPIPSSSKCVKIPYSVADPKMNKLQGYK